jgi:arylsulfatase A-like enzyme/Tfp pilus assembly protein PilF
MREACRKLARRSVWLGFFATLSLACGCADGTDDQAPNLLLVTIDTVRADRLGCYGSGEAATPSLDRIAAEGALFDKAIAVAPITLPSHVSLLTGKYPPRHGVRLNGDFYRPGAGTTLAEHLASRGYTTAAVVASYVLSADFGIARGFGSFDEPREDRTITPAGKALRHYAIVERPAAEVTDAALQLLDGRLDAPFFLWLHYYDPHGEYVPPEPFASRFAESPYDGEIAYVDAQLGRLLDALRAEDRLDDTLVAVTSDHGECLGDHREETHGLFVYDAVLRVPLLLRFPAQVPAGTRSDHLVAGVDLAPTLLELLGQPPMAEIDGVSFAAAARGETPPPREPAYAESELPRRAYGWAALHALHGGDRKFIDAPQRELYDLKLDPGETRNLADAAQEEVAEWARRLAALEAGWPAERSEAELVLDAEARARLDALGYVSSGEASPPERAARPDPKNLVQLHNLLLDAQKLVARGALPQAQELVGKALKSDPANPAALAMGGTLFCSTGDCELGVELLASAAGLAPQSYQTQRNLGNALHLAGRYPEAAEAYRAAVALHPLDAEDHYALGNVLFAMRDVDGAIASYDEAARLGLDAAPFHAALGVARAAAGDADGARAALQRAVDADPGLADAWNQLGILSEKAGRLEEARGSYGRALELRPDHVDALFNDAKVCLRLGLVDAADAGVARLLAARPDLPAGRFLEAQVRLAQGDEAAARRALERLLAADDVNPRLVAAARELEQRLGN